MPDRMNARKNVKCPNRCQIECQKECQIHIDRMSVYMPERMSHRMSEMDRHVIYCKMQNDLSELCQDSFSGLGSLNMEFYVCMYVFILHVWTSASHTHRTLSYPYYNAMPDIRRTWPSEASSDDKLLSLNSAGMLQVLWHFYHTLISARCPEKPCEVLWI